VDDVLHVTLNVLVVIRIKPVKVVNLSWAYKKGICVRDCNRGTFGKLGYCVPHLVDRTECKSAEKLHM